MAGDQPEIDVSNEYGNKLLNGEGLLHLVGTIKTEISNAGGGGATYTAGDGIEIDSNNVISLLSNKTSLLPILFSVLTRNSGMARQDTLLQVLWQNKFMRSNIQAHIDNLHTFGMTYFSDGLNQNTIQSLATEFYETMPSLILFRYNATEFTDQYTFGLAQTSLAPNNSNWNTKFANKPVFVMYVPEASAPWIFITYPEKMFQNMYFNSQQGLSSHSIAGAIDELAQKKQDTLTAGTGIDITNGVISATSSGGGSSLPADPANDGTYFLTTTVSSGTATQAWTSIPNANGNNF